MNSAKKKLPPLGIEPGASCDQVTLVRGCSSTSLLILWMGFASKGLVFTLELGRNKSDTSLLIKTSLCVFLLQEFLSFL